MRVHSAGILCFRYRTQVLEVFLVHPGGPFWVSRDDGAWSIPKGIMNADESALAAAKREFHEETGFEVSDNFIALGQLQQPSKKIVHAWAANSDFDERKLTSNCFHMEWPRGSGQVQDYPEVDRGAWYSIEQARIKIYPGQEGFLDRLLNALQSEA